MALRTSLSRTCSESRRWVYRWHPASSCHPTRRVRARARRAAAGTRRVLRAAVHGRTARGHLPGPHCPGGRRPSPSAPKCSQKNASPSRPSPRRTHTHVQGALSPSSALDQDGADWTAALAHIDDVHAVPFEPAPSQYLGLATPHTLELRLRPRAHPPRAEATPRAHGLVLLDRCQRERGGRRGSRLVVRPADPLGPR